ncbi:MAG: 50S ribosomal protein L2 [Candidatus Micrarchaeaceae archaeon]
MGKRLRQQRRGKGSNAYAKPSHRFHADVTYAQLALTKSKEGEVISLDKDPAHTSPLMEVMFEDKVKAYFIAPEGIKIGDKIEIGKKVGIGNIMKLSDIPEGMLIYNIENIPGDGGKFARTAGAYGLVVAKGEDFVSVQLPSKKIINLKGDCLATIGVAAGGGMNAQPIMKAGKSYYIAHAINKMWPRVRGVKMNPVDHPFGGKQHHKGASSMVSRNAPPGAKVGHIAARRVGRKKR